MSRWWVLVAAVLLVLGVFIGLGIHDSVEEFAHPTPTVSFVPQQLETK